MESATKEFRAISDFDELPNKIEGTETTDVWPEYGLDFVLNRFYCRFDGAEGWLGDGYLAIWKRKEIVEYRLPNLEAYPENYWFFASDGGGTQFGFLVGGDDIQFCSAPNIGSEEDIRFLGGWQDFLNSVKNADYI